MGFSQSLAKELGAFGIRVNVVAPGTIETSLAKHFPKDQFEKERDVSIPLCRPGLAKEVAELCIFLVSDKSSYITGSVHDVNGGLGENPSAPMSER